MRSGWQIWTVGRGQGWGSAATLWTCRSATSATTHRQQAHARASRAGARATHRHLDALAFPPIPPARPERAQTGDALWEDPDHDAFRRILLTLLEAGGEWPADAPVDPADPKWNFWYRGIDFFINVSTRHHRLRRSRNLGHPFTLVVQSRASFDRLPVQAAAARRQIRGRIAAYDGLGLSPHLGTHGDAPELPQYFLGDTNGCPYAAVTEQDVTSSVNSGRGQA
ncbi:YqcI/YcgG family protein [Streptomyces sp. NPDC058525]|uniref:YqcI/YcgG family protein n=1 Tax=Streptomyces sp. NPDC058525 TaxID=3346538 RepID=UPI0036698A8A